MVGDPVCGATWQESLVRFDRDTSSWRTHHCLWDEVLPESSVRLPKWGMMRGGELWEREMPEHLTSETGSGLWPIPTCADSWNPSTMKSAEREWTQGNLRGIAAAPVKMWPTPSARDWKDSPGMSKEGVNPDGSVRKRDDQLARRVYSTPTKSDGTGGPGRSAGRLGGDNLRTQIGGQLNPTWVEWLMGWPIGWTALNVLETDKSPSVQPWLGES